MARLQHAVIWTGLAGQPRKMGNLVLTDEQAAFTYTRDYLDSGLPGFCLLGDGRLWGQDSVIYPISERIPVFPRLVSLIPGNNPRNLQRRHYLDLLRARLGREPPPAIETEWQLLLMGGHGGIGHIDVFANDLDAESWYQRDSRSDVGQSDETGVSDRSDLWRMLKHTVMDENVDFDPQIVEQTLGPTPSVGGMIPKLLVAIDDVHKEARFYPPGTPGKVDVVLKVEPPEYPGLLDLEALCLDLHRQAGFAVPVYHRFVHQELHFLAIERFDRDEQGALPMESLFSVIATGDHQFRETGDILLEELGGIIQRLGEVVSLAADTAEQLYRRILMALLTGNGDLHLDNLALLGGIDDCRLAPVYDPSPMRAWPRHNLVSAIPFDPAGFPDHGAYFVALGRRYGLSSRLARQCVEDALQATETYNEQVMQLERAPLKQRQQLNNIAARERELLQQHAGG